MKLENSDYFVRIIPFPNYGADGLVVSNGDGTLTIILNANITRERQISAFNHELRHIEREDLFSDGDVAEMERDAG